MLWNSLAVDLSLSSTAVLTVQPRTESRQYLVADRARGFGDLIERHRRPDELHPVSRTNVRRRHSRHVDASQIHGDAPYHRHANAIDRGRAHVAQVARITVGIADAHNRKAGWRQRCVRGAVTDRERFIDFADLQYSRLERHYGLERIRTIAERITAIERDAGPHKVAAITRVAENRGRVADTGLARRKQCAQRIETSQLTVVQGMLGLIGARKMRDHVANVQAIEQRWAPGEDLYLACCHAET